MELNDLKHFFRPQYYLLCLKEIVFHKTINNILANMTLEVFLIIIIIFGTELYRFFFLRFLTDI